MIYDRWQQEFRTAWPIRGTMQNNPRRLAGAPDDEILTAAAGRSAVLDAGKCRKTAVPAWTCPTGAMAIRDNQPSTWNVFLRRCAQACPSRLSHRRLSTDPVGAGLLAVGDARPARRALDMDIRKLFGI